MLHPMTGLPTGTEVDELLAAHQALEDWCVMYVALEGFEAFDGDVAAARKVLRFMAYLLTDVVEELGGPFDWAAHPGGDEFLIATEREYANRIQDRTCAVLKMKRSAFTIRLTGRAALPRSNGPAAGRGACR
jgi:GGDEF domain-containing protein